MALIYPDKIKTNNPAAYSIIDLKEAAGAKTVAKKSDLYALPDAALSSDKQGADALGTLYYVQDEKEFYYLADWAKRKTADGWRRTSQLDSVAGLVSAERERAEKAEAALETVLAKLSATLQSGVYLPSNFINGVQHYAKQTLVWSDKMNAWGAEWSGDYIIEDGTYKEV